MTTRRTYTVPEVAEMLGISRSTAYVCIRRGEIPSLTLGRRIVISKMAFEAFLAAHTPATTAPAREQAATVTDPLRDGSEPLPESANR